MEQSQTVTSNGLSLQYTVFPTKKEIIQKLFTEGKITFDEMWILMQEEVKYIPQPYPIYPYNPYPQLPWTTCSSNNQQDGNK